MPRNYVKKHPADIRRTLLSRKFPPCPFCGEIPTYPAHKRWCNLNPEAEANRQKMSEGNRKIYDERGIREKVKEGHAKNMHKIRENGSRVLKALWAERKLNVGRKIGYKISEETKERIRQARYREVIAKKGYHLQVAMKNHNVTDAVITQVEEREFSLFDDPFFSGSKGTMDSDGWIEVDTWSIQDE